MNGTLQTPIPVLLRLSRYEGDLLKATAETLSTGTGEAGTLLEQGRMVLLLDGFDELPNKRSLLEDLEQLALRVPLVPYVLTSRPDPALAVVSPAIAVRYDLAPLGDGELERLLALHLGDDGADQLLQAFEDRGLVEPFRQPLMAWLATLADRAGSKDEVGGRRHSEEA